MDNRKKIPKIDDVTYYDVINFSEFYSFSTWILVLNIYDQIKTGNYVKQFLLSFQNMKTELKKLL